MVSLVLAALLAADAPPPAAPPQTEPAALDTVHLAGGGRARGSVMEDSPQAGVRIQLSDGTVRQYSRAEVVRVEYAGEAAAPVVAPPPQPYPAQPYPAPYPPPAQGEPEALMAGYHTHDGFFLQLHGGFGALGSSASLGGNSVDVSGGGSFFGIALGGSVTPNLVIAADLWGASVAGPDVKVNGSSLSTCNGSGGLCKSSDASIGLSGIGVNFTYYFTPSNFYLTAVPSIGTLTVNSSSGSGKTNSGFAFRLAGGKEWWVSPNWGVGFSLQYAHSSNEDQGTNAPTWETNWFGATFSATYN